MSFHFKVGGEWKTTERPYTKVGGAWKPGKEIWYKRAGVWERVYEYDVDPPTVPVLSVELVETTYWEMVDGEREKLSGRHLKIGVRSGSAVHESDLKLIRVLARQPDGAGGYKAPDTQFGATYIRGAQDNYPDEPWSDFSFNGHNGSKLTKDSSITRYKTFPRNSTVKTSLAAGKYYFTAWSLDDNNNWTAANPVEITVNKKTPDRISHSGKFQANNSGTLSTEGFTSGELKQAPRLAQRGIWFHGNKLTDNLGTDGKVFMKSAQIYIVRTRDDGQTQADVWLWWHKYGNVDALPLDGTYERFNITKIGTLGKGEGKWFTIPETHQLQMEKGNLKGFGLNNKDPNAATAAPADFSIMKATSDAPRCGEVALVWTENPNLPALHGTS